MIEKDPNEISPSTPGAKLDAGKIRTHLLKDFGLALMAVADLMTKGAEKYVEGGWLSVANGIQRYEDALLGHYLRETYEEYDADMLIPHEVQTAFNALARLELMIRENEDWMKRLLKRESSGSYIQKEKDTI
jgi:hypothetical protein